MKIDAVKREVPFTRPGCPDEVWVGWDVSEVIAAFRASLATMWRNGDDRTLRFQNECRLGETLILRSLALQSSCNAKVVRKRLAAESEAVENAGCIRKVFETRSRADRFRRVQDNERQSRLPPWIVVDLHLQTLDQSRS